MRPTWDQYFMGIADLAATRSPCLRRHVGAVIEKDHQVLAIGWNGPPSGFTHCVEKEEPCYACSGKGTRVSGSFISCQYCGGTGIKHATKYYTSGGFILEKIPVCLRTQMNVPSGQRYELCRASHAEFSAISQAAKKGIEIENSNLYCTCFPCIICAKAIISAGIKKIYYKGDFVDEPSKEMLSQACELINLG